MCSGVFDPTECIRKRVDFDVRYGVEALGRIGPIPVNTPAFRGDERKFLLDCIDGGWSTRRRASNLPQQLLATRRGHGGGDTFEEVLDRA